MDLTSNNTHTIDTDTKTPPQTQPTKIKTPKSLSFTPVTLKRPPHLHSAAAATTMVLVSYKECLKNHAASIGGHALDGCGEFMPSSSTNPSDPRSLKCAACGCHRNFHRRDPPEPTTTTNNNNNPSFLNCFYSPPPSAAAAATAPPPPPPQPLPHRAISQSTSPSLSSSPSHSPSPMSSPSSPPPLSHVPPSYHHHHQHQHQHHSSAPHMLLALGNAYSAVALPSSDHHHEHQHRNNNIINHNNNNNNNNHNNNSCFVVKGHESGGGNNKKRYRTKFSQEQKEKMYSFSERLGWRMQKGDDGLVQEFCNDIGVPRGVFKVWMHNNKNTFKNKRSSEPPIPNQNTNIIDDKINNNDREDDDDDDDEDGIDAGGGGVAASAAAGEFDSDINNAYNTNGSNNNTNTNTTSDIHTGEDGCVNNAHVPINGLSS